MIVLFVLAAEDQSCFYLLSLQKDEKTLLRFGPEQKIAGRKLGTAYQAFGRDKERFCSWLSDSLKLSIAHYVILTQVSLVDFLFDKKATISVRNPKSFTYHGLVGGEYKNVTDSLKKEQTFSKGLQLLDSEAFSRFIAYQEDAPGVFGVFARQEHVLRLIKEQLLSSVNPAKFLRKYNELKKYVQTDLNMSGLLKLLTSYQEGRETKIERITHTNSTDITLF